MTEGLTNYQLEQLVISHIENIKQEVDNEDYESDPKLMKEFRIYNPIDKTKMIEMLGQIYGTRLYVRYKSTKNALDFHISAPNWDLTETKFIPNVIPPKHKYNLRN